jgi:hypothetical protein
LIGTYLSSISKSVLQILQRLFPGCLLSSCIGILFIFSLFAPPAGLSAGMVSVMPPTSQSCISIGCWHSFNVTLVYLLSSGILCQHYLSLVVTIYSFGIKLPNRPADFSNRRPPNLTGWQMHPKLLPPASSKFGSGKLLVSHCDMRSHLAGGCRT